MRTLTEKFTSILGSGRETWDEAEHIKQVSHTASLPQQQLTKTAEHHNPQHGVALRIKRLLDRARDDGAEYAWTLVRCIPPAVDESELHPA